VSRKIDTIDERGFHGIMPTSFLVLFDGQRECTPRSIPDYRLSLSAHRDETSNEHRGIIMAVMPTHGCTAK